MLPVVRGEADTRLQILAYSIVLVPLTLVPWALGLSGWLYGAAATVLGLEFLRRAVAVWRQGEERSARGLFGYSIAYLFLIFVALGVDHWLGWAGA
jgi:protoheme IX farnesyltransferase